MPYINTLKIRAPAHLSITDIHKNKVHTYKWPKKN